MTQIIFKFILKKIIIKKPHIHIMWFFYCNFLDIFSYICIYLRMFLKWKLSLKMI